MPAIISLLRIWELGSTESGRGMGHEQSGNLLCSASNGALPYSSNCPLPPARKFCPCFGPARPLPGVHPLHSVPEGEQGAVMTRPAHIPMSLCEGVEGGGGGITRPSCVQAQDVLGCFGSMLLRYSSGCKPAVPSSVESGQPVAATLGTPSGMARRRT
jgi:hypothetical protein